MRPYPDFKHPPKRLGNWLAYAALVTVTYLLQNLATKDASGLAIVPVLAVWFAIWPVACSDRQTDANYFKWAAIAATVCGIAAFGMCVARALGDMPYGNFDFAPAMLGQSIGAVVVLGMLAVVNMLIGKSGGGKKTNQVPPGKSDAPNDDRN